MNWTEEQDVLLRDGKARGLTFAEIAITIPGRTKAACKIRWRVVSMSAKEFRQYKDIRNAKIRQQHCEAGLGRYQKFIDAATVVPPDVWAERNARLSEPRPLSAWLMGDPPPSRSALRQREVRA